MIYYGMFPKRFMMEILAVFPKLLRLRRVLHTKKVGGKSMISIDGGL